MRTRRFLRAILTQLAAALLKVVVTSLVFGIIVVSIMYYMGVPVPDAELLEGVSKLAHILS